jgi:cytochrome oxidase assembly protein ShyY1
MRLINSTAIAATLPYPITSGYIGLLTVEPQQPGGFQPIQLPELSEGPHFWYAVQWFMFTAVAVAGIVVFIRSDLRARREERDEAAQAHVTV